jgi:uncharacterized protein YoxC
MVLVAVVLLGLILLVLIGILLTCRASLNDLRKYTESIHGHLYESKQSLQLLVDRASRLTDDIESIYHVATDIKFQQENLEKYEIDKAIKTLEGIELSLSDLKLLHDTLSSLERSLDIIVAHPAFTARYDDNPL